MSKLCIFKVWGGRGYYAVCRCRLPENRGIVYRVYFDRRLAGAACEFVEPDEAIARAVGFAVTDCTYSMKGGIV